MDPNEQAAETSRMFAFLKVGGLGAREAAAALSALSRAVAAGLGAVELSRPELYRRLVELLPPEQRNWSRAPPAAPGIGTGAAAFADLPREMRLALFLLIGLDFTLCQTGAALNAEPAALGRRLDAALTQLGAVSLAPARNRPRHGR